MKQNRTKWILFFISIITQSVFAQQYSIKITPSEEGFYDCEMCDFVKNIENTDQFSSTYAKLSVSAAYNRTAIFQINIASWRDDVGSIFNKTTNQSNGCKYKTILHKIYLDNGELLYTNDASLYDIRKEGWYQGTNVGIGFVGFNCRSFESNKVNMDEMSEKQKQQYVSQQLRNHSITKIIIDNATIYFKNFRTRDVYNDIFNTLGKKIGQPELFEY